MTRLILLLLASFTAFSSFAAETPPPSTDPSCERLIDDGSSSYAPTRDSLYASKFKDDEDGGYDWQFGHTIIDEFYGLKVRGLYDKIAFGAGDQVFGVKEGRTTQIGHLAEKVSTGSGDMTYAVDLRQIILNDDVKVRFNLFAKDKARYWVAIFE